MDTKVSVPGSTRARIIALLGWAAAMAVVAGCKSGSFACENDQSCRSDGQGWCEADGACSFADPTCPSGRRYGDLGPADIAGECVPGTGTDATSGGGGSTSAEETGAETVASLEGNPLETTTNAEVDTSTTGVGTTASLDDTSGSTTSATTSPSTSGPDTLTGNDGDPYGQCDGERSDCPVGIVCEPSGAMPLTCVPPCEADGDCPPPTSGESVPVCMSPPGEGSWCVLPCLGENQCPEGMQCSSWQRRSYGNICTWF